MVPFSGWPAEDRSRWQEAVKERDRFDEMPNGARLSPATLRNRQEGYGRFLRFATDTHQALLALPPEARVDRDVVAQYVSWRRGLCHEGSVAADLFNLHGTLKLICPAVDWSWLLTIAKRIGAVAPRQPPRHHLVTSERLYVLGIELMDGAATNAAAAECINEDHASQYRDGVIVALLALIPLRRRTAAALRVGRQLVKLGDLWHLDIPARDTKNHRPLDYVIPKELSGRIDRYVEQFRNRIPSAHRHDGLWPSKIGSPMSGEAIYRVVRKRTRKAFGFAVNMHRFRHAAASFWSIHDPINVRGVKDLLGHASFTPSEKHYIMAQSRLAGRAIARAISKVGKSHFQGRVQSRRESN
jgi:integrase/recombinase XerD